MHKAQVLVTVTAEALVDVPDGTIDVEAYCRERVSLDWGGLTVDRLIHPPQASVEHYLISPLPSETRLTEAPQDLETDRSPTEVAQALVETERDIEPEAPVAEPVLLEEATSGETAAIEAASPDLRQAVDEELISDVIRQAISSRAEQLLEEVVAQVITELEPLLRRHLSRQR